MRAALGLGFGLPLAGAQGDTSSLYPLSGSATLIADFINNRYFSRASTSAPFTPTTFAGMFNFSRDTGGSYFGSDGFLKMAGVGIARFQYDPATLSPQGILIEDASTNLLTFSNTLSDASWVKTGVGSPAKNANGPAGTSNEIWTITEDSSTGSVHALTKSTVKAASTITYAASIFVAPSAGSRNIALGISNGTGTAGTIFNPNTGAVVSTFTVGVTTGITAVTTFAKQCRNGIWRFSVVSSVDSAFLAVGVFAGLANGTSVSYNGDGTSSLVMGDVQLEGSTSSNNIATSYIDCPSSSQVTRNLDQCTHTLGSEYNSTEGTIYFNLLTPPYRASARNRAFTVDDGTTGNSIIGGWVNPSEGFIFNFGTVVGGVGQGNSNTGANTLLANTQSKIAGAYKVANQAACANASVVATASPAAVPAATTLRVGLGLTAAAWDSTISMLVYYPSRLSNAQLQAITT